MMRTAFASEHAAVTGLPPSLSSPSIVQSYRYLRNPLALLDECTQRFGDMFTLRLAGSVPWVLVSSPPLLKALFSAPPDLVHAGEANATVFGPIAGNASVFTMDESAHLDRRRLLLPQFHGDRMRVYFDQIRDIAMRIMDRWRIGVSFAMNRETQQMTLHAIIRAVFGVETNPDDRGARGLVQALTALANNAVGSSLLLAHPLQRDWGPWSPWVASFESFAGLTPRFSPKLRGGDPPAAQAIDTTSCRCCSTRAAKTEPG
jgi:cytochrome P450